MHNPRLLNLEIGGVVTATSFALISALMAYGGHVKDAICVMLAGALIAVVSVARIKRPGPSSLPLVAVEFPPVDGFITISDDQL